MRFGLACSICSCQGQRLSGACAPRPWLTSWLFWLHTGECLPSILRLACCSLPLEYCGHVVRSGLGPLITLLANHRQPCGLTMPHFYHSHSYLGSYYFVYDTPRFIPSFTKCPSSFTAYIGMPHLSLHFCLSFCRALWIIITVIKVNRPLWGHNFSTGRSGNNRSCWQCFSNCTIPSTKAETKQPTDYTAAWFGRSMHTYKHHYMLLLHWVRY